MSKKSNKFEPSDFDEGESIDSILKEFELDLPDEDDAFFGIEIESLEEYLEKVDKKKIKIGSIK